MTTSVTAPRWEQMGGSCPTLLCPRWVILLFVKKSQGRARQRVTDETLGTSYGGGSLHGRHHHGMVFFNIKVLTIVLTDLVSLASTK